MLAIRGPHGRYGHRGTGIWRKSLGIVDKQIYHGVCHGREARRVARCGLHFKLNIKSALWWKDGMDAVENMLCQQPDRQTNIQLKDAHVGYHVDLVPALDGADIYSRTSN